MTLVWPREPWQGQEMKRRVSPFPIEVPAAIPALKASVGKPIAQPLMRQSKMHGKVLWKVEVSSLCG